MFKKGPFGWTKVSKTIGSIFENTCLSILFDIQASVDSMIDFEISCFLYIRLQIHTIGIKVTD